MPHSALIALDDSTPIDAAAPASLVVIGNFDGVHRGHQAVLAEAVAQAATQRLVPVVLTFDPHPEAVVGEGVPPVLTTVDRRAELLGELGIARVYVRRFDAAFATWSPDRFARDLVARSLCARVVLVGENFRFGAKAAGDLAMLRALGAELGFEVCVHGLAGDAGGPFSSTRVRACVAAADLDGARALLGRPHAISGTVVHGAKRGRTIGVPTANLDAIAELVPPNGVYAVSVERVDDGARAMASGVMNVGVRPTVGGDPARSVEVHLLDFDGDLYGQSLRVHVVARLRDERRFDGLDALKAQIARDVDDARRVLK